jgi:hypothetical protein
LDADKDVNARYQNIKSKAKDKNFYQNLPDSMPKTGLIHTEVACALSNFGIGA